MTHPSDRALRRSAWGVWWFTVAVFAVGLALSFAAAENGGPSPDLAFTFVILTFPLVGLLILRRQPRNSIGWLLIGIGFAWGLSGVAENYAVYGLVVDPGSLPAADVVAALGTGSWAPGIGLMGTFLILLYPDGHLPSPRWRPVAWLSAIAIVALVVIIDLSPGRVEMGSDPDLVNPLGLEAARSTLSALLYVFLPLLTLCFGACAVSLVRRFRRSRGVERLQLKWLASAGALVTSLYLLAVAGSFFKPTPFSGEDPAWLVLMQQAAGLSFVLLPTAIGIAILRHRLYDIDLVINRALVYGALTATLALVYLASVLMLHVVLRPLTDSSDLAVAGSTLAVAALFGPARRRIQSTVDRRFYRHRYDAARTMDAFVGRLRNELDLDAVGADLRRVVAETVAPAHVSLWLRSSR